MRHSVVRVISLHIVFLILGGTGGPRGHKIGSVECGEDVRIEVYGEPDELVELYADNEKVAEDTADANGQAVLSGKCPETGWCHFQVRREISDVVVETTTFRLRRG